MKVKTNRERIFQTYRKAPPLHLHLNMVRFRMVCCFVSRCFGVLRRWFIAGLDAAYQEEFVTDRIRYTDSDLCRRYMVDFTTQTLCYNYNYKCFWSTDA